MRDSEIKIEKDECERRWRSERERERKVKM